MKAFLLSQPLQLPDVLCGTRCKEQGGSVTLRVSKPEIDHAILAENTRIAVFRRFRHDCQIDDQLAPTPVITGCHHAPQFGVRTREIRDCRGQDVLGMMDQPLALRPAHERDTV